MQAEILVAVHALLYILIQILKKHSRVTDQCEMKCDDEDNVDEYLNKKIYTSSEVTVGEAVLDVLEFYIENCSTKVSIEKLLKLLNKMVPKPNNIPKTKYHLTKLLEKLLPFQYEEIQKYRVCEECSHFLGNWKQKPQVTVCESCKSKLVNGIFVQYNLKSLLKNAFENQNLKNLIDEYTDKQRRDSNFVSDITSGSSYKELKNTVLINDYDLCLLWNVDGLPISNSSKGQVYLVQVQILNVHPSHRNDFRYVTSIYYSREKKPNMMSFLRRFVD